VTTVGKQPSRALLISAGVLTQLVGATCFVLGLASVPAVHDMRAGMTGVLASIVAAVAAIVCGTLVWRGRLIPLALAAGLDVGFGIGLPRGGSAVGAMLRMLPADDARLVHAIVVVAAVFMFVAAVMCVLAVPAALKLRQWARTEIAASQVMPAASDPDEIAPTRERPSLQRPSQMPLPPPPQTVERPPLSGMQRSQKLMPTQVINIGPGRRGLKPAIIVGVAVTLIAVGVIVMSATLSSKPDGLEPKAISVEAHPADASTTDVAASAVAADAPLDVAEPPPLADFVEQFHTALASGELAPLVAANGFAIGADSNDLAEGRDAVVEQIRGDTGNAAVRVKFSFTGQEADTAWLAEELAVGSKTFAVTAGLALRDNAWTIVALHMAEPMPNATAYRLAREGTLSTPDVIPNTNDTSELAHAVATAFASKPSFVDARSTRPDAFNFGSAPGERLEGGETIKKVFGRIDATIKLHDAVKVGPLGASGGWGVANVDFTESLRDGDVTQTFRVLAVLLKEDTGWRITLTQFSNAR
jgi:hypothetical protein